MQALGIWSALATVLFVMGGMIYGEWRTNYLIWNLGLAWIPVILGWCLTRVGRWSDGYRKLVALVLAVAWMGFLPNSFYVITDVMHLADMPSRLPLFYSSVMFWVFGFVGAMAGLMSVRMIHEELSLRAQPVVAYVAIELVLLLSSWGMYLGRIERWNSWDVIVQPLGLVQSVAEGLGRSEAALVAVYFVLLSGLYAGFWSLKSISKN